MAHVRAADENAIIAVQWLRRTPTGKVQLVPARDVGPGQSGTAPNEALLAPTDPANASLADAAHQTVATAAISTASVHKQVAISGPVKLASGDAGFYMAVPVEGHEFSGDIAKVESRSAMVGLIDAQILVADALSPREPLSDSLQLQQYGSTSAVAPPASQVRIVSGGQVLGGIGAEPQNPVSGSINVAGQVWNITVGGGSLSAGYAALPWLVLGIGLALTVMVGQAISQARRRRDAALALANERWQELVHRANHDHLTGLPNRTQFLQLLSSAVERSKLDGSQK